MRLRVNVILIINIRYSFLLRSDAIAVFCGVFVVKLKNNIFLLKVPLFYMENCILLRK